MNKEELILLINENLTIAQIAARVKKSKSTVERALVAFGLKTNHYHDILSKKRKCRCCGIIDFTKKFPSSVTNGKVYYRWQCKECYIFSKNEYKWNLADWVDEQKKNLSCEICKVSDFRILDFHHKDEDCKLFNVSEGAWKVGKEKLIAEINKCVALCANCHRILTYENRLKKGYRNKGFKYFS